MYTLGFFVTVLPLLAQAAPQMTAPDYQSGTSTSTAMTTTSQPPPYAVTVPTQAITLTPADHAAIEDLVNQLDAHLGSLQRRGPLPNIKGLIKYIPSVIIPTIFNMAYDMIKDVTGADDPADSAAPAANVTARDAALAHELNAELERRGLGSLAASIGSRLGSVSLGPVLTWLPALIPALIGPAFAIAQEVFDHFEGSGAAASSTTAAAPVAVATPAASPAAVAPVNGTAGVARRGAADDVDFAALVKDIQSMIVDNPGILSVPASPADVPLHTMMSPGIATLTTSVPAASAIGASY